MTSDVKVTLNHPLVWMKKKKRGCVEAAKVGML